MESESTPADRNQLQVWPRALETVRGGSFGMSGRKAVYERRRARGGEVGGGPRD